MDLPEMVQWMAYHTHKQARMDRDMEMARMKAESRNA